MRGAALEREAPVLHVEDDGPGIPPAERDRIFEPFARVAGDRRARARGSGLALVAQQAGHHGATSSSTTPALGGARFRVRFGAAGGE